MTCDSWSTSMPRAAISVAISTRSSWFLKPVSARCRAFCDLFPCMASALIPDLLRVRASLSAPYLVLVKISTDLIAGFFSRWISKSFSLFLNEIDWLGDCVNRGRCRGDFYFLGVRQHGVCQDFYFRRHCGRKKRVCRLRAIALICVGYHVWIPCPASGLLRPIRRIRVL